MNLFNPEPNKTTRLKTETPSKLYAIVSIAVFSVFAGILFASAPYGFQIGDEAFLLTDAHRLMLGERWIIHNWSTVQFFSIFNYLPFRLFVSVTGGTEGVILFMRYFYVCIKLIFSLFLFISMRRYRYWGLLSSVIFLTFHPMGFLSLNYYTVSIMALYTVAVIVFIKQRQTAFEWFFCGILLSCSVLAEPSSAIVYFVYSAFVVISVIAKKTKKTFFGTISYVLKPRSWLFLTLGVLVSAAGFLAILLTGVQFSDLWENIITMVSFLRTFSLLSIKEKLHFYLSDTGVVSNSAAIVFLGFLLIKRRHPPKLKPCLFLIGCLIFCGLTLEMYLRKGISVSAVFCTAFKPIPLCFFGLVCYLLTERKNRKLFYLYLFGMLSSVGICFLSRIGFGLGGIISTPACLLFLRDFWIELKERPVQAKKPEPSDQPDPTVELSRTGIPARKRFARICIIPILVFLILTETYFGCSTLLFHNQEITTSNQPFPVLSEKIEYGPHKGIYTIDQIKKIYVGTLQDMDLILEDSPGSLFVMDFCGWCNLYANIPYASFSITSSADTQYREVLISYWQSHPQNRPDYIYIPFFNADSYKNAFRDAKDNLSFICQFCRYDIRHGNKGYLIRVLEWTLE